MFGGKPLTFLRVFQLPVGSQNVLKPSLPQPTYLSLSSSAIARLGGKSERSNGNSRCQREGGDENHVGQVRSAFTKIQDL